MAVADAGHIVLGLARPRGCAKRPSHGAVAGFTAVLLLQLGQVIQLDEQESAGLLVARPVLRPGAAFQSWSWQSPDPSTDRWCARWCAVFRFALMGHRRTGRRTGWAPPGPSPASTRFRQEAGMIKPD